MAERMVFLPKAEVLSLEELDRVASVFIGLGVKKLRLTGGEPLVRKGFMELVRGLSRHLQSGGGLQELTLTTNGTRLAHHAAELADLGVRRINVSLDTLKPDLFRTLTRGGDLAQVMAGLEAARAAGISLKINTVALARDNAAEIPALIQWAHGDGMDLTLIETMPMGEIDQDRIDQYLPLSIVRAELRKRWTLTETAYRTGGPARYFDIAETGTRIGFITPMTHNFCESCNRVRLTCTGTLYMCLGQEDSAEFRELLRDPSVDEAALRDAILAAIARKPKGHDFVIDRRTQRPAVGRHMSVTGG
jgi:cyclic pyranopterin phosphate synthase